MLPSVNKMAVLKILIDRDKPMKCVEIQQALKEKYGFKISMGRVSAYAKDLSIYEYVFSSRTNEFIPNGTRRINYSITEEGKEYYKQLRLEYIKYVNTANRVLGLPLV